MSSFHRTIIPSPQGGVRDEARAVAALLELLGHPEAWVSDESLLCDFLSVLEYPSKESAQKHLDKVLPVSGISPSCTLLEAITVIRKNNPDWPDHAPTTQPAPKRRKPKQ